VLSNGHGSMLLYALLHLTGYDLPIEELKHFRQLHSKTPGHPEYGYTPGVETTTGPLGQGIANAVGMALAEKLLAATSTVTATGRRPPHLRVPGRRLPDGGHLARGLLAGRHLGLGKLIAFYDDNGISIDGEVEGWFTDDTPALRGLRLARGARRGRPRRRGREAPSRPPGETDRPSLICCKTIIGWGAPNKQGKEECHGAPLGKTRSSWCARHGLDARALRDPRRHLRRLGRPGARCTAREAWNRRFAAYAPAHPELAAEFERRMAGELPADFAAGRRLHPQTAGRRPRRSPRARPRRCDRRRFAPRCPELLGGSADLTGSNLTMWKGSAGISRERRRRQLHVHYGVREFGMAAIMNGIALHGGFIPYGGTFLVFSDYARNAVRMAALMGSG
jgi:transketolase